MTSNWTYNGTEIIDESQFPDGAVAFVYKITRLSDGKAYIGKKLTYFTKTSVKTVVSKAGVKKKKKIRALVPSDWKSYWSSSVELVESVQTLGSDAFTREILAYCANKATASYIEARYQFDLRVLEDRSKWFNGIINLRVNHAHLRPLLN